MKSLLHATVSIPPAVFSPLLIFFFLGFSIYSAKSQVVLSVENASGAQNVAVDVTVENWDDVVSCQFTLKWDPAFLSLDSIGNFGFPSPENAQYGTSNIGIGLAPLSWFEPTALSTPLADGSVILTMYFDVLQEGYTIVDITGELIEIELVDSNVNTLAYIINSGSVNGVGTLVQGNVYHDLNDDCLFQMGENGLDGWLLKFTGEQSFYASTNADGDYSILADTGDYVVDLILPNDLWLACDNSVVVDLSGTINPFQLDFSVKSVTDCPLMQVDISTPFLRRCFSNNYYVDYCNVGTITAVDPFVEIELDEFLTVISSSAAYTISPEGLYIFELADLEAGDCGNFTIEALLNCDSTIVGQTHCVSAHAYPDSLCIPPNINWSGASLQIDGDCTADQVQLTITNIGEDMTAESQYIVIEDAVMYAPNNFLLLSGATMPLSFAANGSTYRLEVDQVAGHPGNSIPSLVLEGCGTNSNGEFSIGFVNQFSEDDNDSWISIDCQESIGSYDPNDKASSPEGYGLDHFIEPNVDIEYKIRFQNTGTDTAFTVVVEDSLSSFLDPSTLRTGTSSHPYDFELTDQGLLRFTFDNIMLPDSNVNEAASHGFVKFKIAQVSDLPDGTLINNEAAIYFDFNEAVWTNNTFLEVQREFITLNTQRVFVEGIEVKVYPNPFSETTMFEVKGKDYKALKLKVFDSTGRLLSSKVYDSQPFGFSADTYSRGLYFYQIYSDDTLISTGKLIKQ